MSRITKILFALFMTCSTLPAQGALNSLVPLLPIMIPALMCTMPSSNYRTPYGMFWWKRTWVDNNSTIGELTFKPTILEKGSITQAYISQLYVRDDQDRDRVRSALLNAFEQELATQCHESCTITLHACAKTSPFYEKHGFSCDSLHKCSKELATAMQKSVTQGT